MGRLQRATAWAHFINKQLLNYQEITISSFIQHSAALLLAMTLERGSDTLAKEVIFIGIKSLIFPCDEKRKISAAERELFYFTRCLIISVYNIGFNLNLL